MDLILFNQLQFSPDLSSAIDPAGRKIRFSKRERALLRHLSEHPGQLLSRDRLVDAVNGTDDVLDRNIDYLVSRLRRKLGDPARTPRFIATEYGQGYRWIAHTETRAQVTEVFLTIGPVLGMDSSGELAGKLETGLVRVRDLLSDKLGPEREVALRPIAPVDNPVASHYGLELSFIHVRGQMRCSSVLRDGRRGCIYQTWQHTLAPDFDARAAEALQDEFARQVHAGILTAAMRRPKADRRPTEAPLSVALDQAAELFSADADPYEQVSAFLRNKLAENPADHYSAILLASNLHLAIIRRELDSLQNADWIEAALREMDTLLIEHLSGVQDDPLFLSAAAMLLYFVGHRDMAASLAESALDMDPSLGAALMVYAQIQMFEGDLECALEYYEYALQRSEPESQFRSMILVLKALALRAAGVSEGVERIVEEVVSRDESFRILLNLSLLGDLTACDPGVARLAVSLKGDVWQQMIRRVYYVSARLFRLRVHKERVIYSVLSQAIQHAGEDALVEEVRSDLPQLCQALLGKKGTDNLKTQNQECPADWLMQPPRSTP